MGLLSARSVGGSLAFAISHGGENDLKKHASTDMHKRATKHKGASIATFFANSTAEQDRIAACEITSVYL